MTTVNSQQTLGMRLWTMTVVRCLLSVDQKIYYEFQIFS